MLKKFQTFIFFLATSTKIWYNWQNILSGINMTVKNSRQTILLIQLGKVVKMIEIMYNPEDVGKEVFNSHGRKSIIRKYHMTDKEIKSGQDKWQGIIKDVDSEIVAKAGTKFFNPYRKGIYYHQIMSMFLLGANEWHSLHDIIGKMEEIMSDIYIKREGVRMTLWEKFRGRSSRDNAIKSKDYVGRVQENMIFFQRLSKLHPYGYKLRQVFSAVDIKRVNREGFSNGCYYYRLSTYKYKPLALPIRDYSGFDFPLHERKYISYKFIGTIVTKDKIITEGKVDEMSSMQSG